VAAQHHQHRGQAFPQRRRTAGDTVTALVHRPPGEVDGDADPVLDHTHADVNVRLFGVDGDAATLRLGSVHDGVLDRAHHLPFTGGELAHPPSGDADGELAGQPVPRFPLHQPEQVFVARFEPRSAGLEQVPQHTHAGAVVTHRQGRYLGVEGVDQIARPLFARCTQTLGQGCPLGQTGKLPRHHLVRTGGTDEPEIVDGGRTGHDAHSTG